MKIFFWISLLSMMLLSCSKDRIKANKLAGKWRLTAENQITLAENDEFIFHFQQEDKKSGIVEYSRTIDTLIFSALADYYIEEGYLYIGGSYNGFELIEVGFNKMIWHSFGDFEYELERL